MLNMSSAGRPCRPTRREPDENRLPSTLLYPHTNEVIPEEIGGDCTRKSLNDKPKHLPLGGPKKSDKANTTADQHKSEGQEGDSTVHDAALVLGSLAELLPRPGRVGQHDLQLKGNSGVDLPDGYRLS